MLTINSIENEIEKIEIYNTLGKLVFENNSLKKSNYYNLNLAYLANGFYIIKINIGNEIITKNIIKQ